MDKLITLQHIYIYIYRERESGSERGRESRNEKRDIQCQAFGTPLNGQRALDSISCCFSEMQRAKLETFCVWKLGICTMTALIMAWKSWLSFCYRVANAQTVFAIVLWPWRLLPATID